MYKVLIVDDEIIICKGLIALVNWVYYGFETPEIVLSGFEALDKTSAVHFDLIITDIRMPGIDGIELIKALRQRNCYAKIIVLSGYSEFQFARSALELGVRNYILKPVKEENFICMLENIKNELDDDIKLKLTLVESKEMLREKVLKELMNLNTDKDYVHKRANDEKIKLDSLRYVVFILAIELLEFSESSFNKEQIKRLIESYSDKYFAFYTFGLDEEQIGILACIYIQEKEKFTQKICEILHELKMRLDSDFIIAMGSFVSESVFIPQSMKNARKALEFKFFRQSESIIFFDEINTIGYMDDTFISHYYSELKNCIKSHDSNTIIIGANEVIDKIINMKWPVKITFSVILSIFIHLMGIISEFGGRAEEILGQQYSLENLNNKKTMEELRRLLVGLCLKISGYIVHSENTKTNKIVNNVVHYIEQNYNEEISIISIAQKFHYNPVYLGRLLKSSLEISFPNFINQYRVEMAVKMLEEDRLMVYEISEKVGYKDVRYFYRIFKQIMGVTPSEYKAKQHKSNVGYIT